MVTARSVVSDRLVSACGLGMVALCLGLAAATAGAQTVVASATWSQNGHGYVVVAFDPGRDRAWAAAEQGVTTQLGAPFRLATISSADEDAFLRGLLEGRGGEWWVGGYQSPATETDPAAGWTWVTGEPFGYANWCQGEPNDAYVPAREQHLALGFGGVCWNDEGSAIGAVAGYVAEAPAPGFGILGSAFGPETLTLDPHTGLKWLDLTLSTPYSYDGIVARLADRTSPFSGYRLATIDEVLVFLRHAGIPPPVDLLTEYYAPIRHLMTYVGVTGRNGNLGTGYPFDYTCGHVFGRHANGWVDGVTISAYEPNRTGWVGVGTVPSDNDNPYHGAWLVAVPVPLHVARAGGGIGRVTSDLAGIDCGEDCDETYAHGTLVTLAAAPAPGHRFSGWSGACASAATTCQVVMEAVRDVTAMFEPPRPFMVSVSTAGTGAGLVSSSPPGISCGGDCGEQFLEGTRVSLTAAPAPESRFAGWRGACAGSGVCEFVVSGEAAVVALFAGSPADLDADLLPDDWERRMGLNPSSDTGDDGSGGDPDGDGRTNLDEYAAGTHPRGFATRYFAEGALTSLFDTEFAVVNAGTSDANVLLRFLTSEGQRGSRVLTAPAGRLRTLAARDVTALDDRQFSTIVESDVPVIVERRMTWPPREPYGAHAETAVAAPAATWYLAEGSTVTGFELFYLLLNPNASEAQVRVRYLRPAGDPLEKTYVLAPGSRTTLWVNHEEFPGLGSALANSDVSAVVEVTNGQPIVVERAMYLDVPGQAFAAGHASAGVNAAATEWFLAEGATGPFFDLFLLIANPGDADAQVEATYQLADGSSVVKPHVVAANRRLTIWVDREDARLADTAVATTVRSTNDVPVVVERAMWWPDGGWYEAHCSPGSPITDTTWVLADGEVDAARGVDTYILIANTSSHAGDVKVTLLFEDGPSVEQTFTGIPAESRFNVPVGWFFPQADGKRFGAVVESLGTTPARTVVEKAMYWDAGGRRWAAGTTAMATPSQAGSIVYDEALSGDLPERLPAGVVVTLGLGVNTISGDSAYLHHIAPDFDSLAVAVPPGAELTRISYAFTTTVAAGALQAVTQFTLDRGNAAPGYPPLAAVNIDLLGASPVLLAADALPLGPGVYGLTNAGMGYGGPGEVVPGWSVHYTWALTVLPRR